MNTLKETWCSAKRHFLSIIIVSVFIVTFITSNSWIAKSFGQSSSEGSFYLSPSNNIFATSSTLVGHRFNVTFWAESVTNMLAYQFAVYYNNTLLNATRAWRPEWDPEWVFYGQATATTKPSFEPDNVLIADTLIYSEDTQLFNGTGKLGVVEFEILIAPTTEKFSCELNITNSLTYWSSPKTPVPQKHYPSRQNGYYEYLYNGIFRQELTHEISIGEQTFYVATLSNASISDLTFNGSLYMISLNARGISGTIAYLNITIPKNLLCLENETEDTWHVYVNESEIVPEVVTNTTHTSLYIEFSSSTVFVRFIGTWAVPEFSNMLSILVLIVFIATLLIASKMHPRFY